MNRLTEEDWTEIYYALVDKQARVEEGELGEDELENSEQVDAATWAAHLGAIIDKIGPDGENMTAAVIATAPESGEAMKHTPGPWKEAPYNKKDGDHDVVDARFRLIAEVEEWNDGGNIALIAAGPEVLQSLKDLEIILSGKPYDKDEQKLLVIARAAIAAAEGRK